MCVIHNVYAYIIEPYVIKYRRYMYTIQSVTHILQLIIASYIHMYM